MVIVWSRLPGPQGAADHRWATSRLLLEEATPIYSILLVENIAVCAQFMFFVNVIGGLDENCWLMPDILDTF